MQSQSVNKTIAAVHADDTEQAREIIRTAISEASEAWLSAAAIGDALMLEYIEIAGGSIGPQELAKHLQEIANQLKRSQDRAH